MLANKQDVKGAMSPEEIEKQLVYNLQSLKASMSSYLNHSHSQRHWRVQPCSAVRGTGLLEGMEWLVSDIGSRIFMFD